MKQITVFTPTYNRAFCLGNLYKSLVEQTVHDFHWLVVDDGSNDGTEKLVQSWIDKNQISISYIFKQNGGMHTGHNLAYANIFTELNVCIDSDDKMPLDAIENILEIWASISNPEVAGIIGADAFNDGRIVGSKIPEDVHYSTLTDIYQEHKVKGDKKLVLRTEVVKEFPAYPVFENERLVPLGTLYKMIEQKYKFRCTNKVLCIVEYLEDGSSHNIIKQYRQSPKGFGHSRIVKMKYSKTFKEKFLSAAHLVSSAIFAKDISLLLRTPNLPVTMLAAPAGVALNLYIRYKTRKR